jgi:hypothetical protein
MPASTAAVVTAAAAPANASPTNKPKTLADITSCHDMAVLVKWHASGSITPMEALAELREAESRWLFFEHSTRLDTWTTHLTLKQTVDLMALFRDSSERILLVARRIFSQRALLSWPECPDEIDTVVSIMKLLPDDGGLGESDSSTLRMNLFADLTVSYTRTVPCDALASLSPSALFPFDAPLCRTDRHFVRLVTECFTAERKRYVAMLYLMHNWCMIAPRVITYIFPSSEPPISSPLRTAIFMHNSNLTRRAQRENAASIRLAQMDRTIKDGEATTTTNICVCCSTREVCVVMEPCGHSYSCRTCHNKWLRTEGAMFQGRVADRLSSPTTVPREAVIRNGHLPSCGICRQQISGVHTTKVIYS